MSPSLLRKIEATTRRPKRDFALWCDTFFTCPGTFDRFQRLTLLETFPEWFAPRVLYEELAIAITEWEIRGVPGLLQIREYAEAMIRASSTSKCVLQILPYNALEAPSPGGPSSLFEFADKKPVAYVEGWHVGWLIEDAER